MTIFDDRSEPEVFKDPADPTTQFARVLSHFMDKRLQSTFSSTMSIEALDECLRLAQAFITDRGGPVPGLDKREHDSMGFAVDGYGRHYREFSITDNLSSIPRHGVMIGAAEEIMIIFPSVSVGWGISQGEPATFRLNVASPAATPTLANACDVFTEMLQNLGMSLEVVK